MEKRDKPNLQLQELATLLSQIQKIVVFDGETPTLDNDFNNAPGLLFCDKVVKLRDFKDVATREVKHIDGEMFKTIRPGTITIWVY
jgi:hypothetical protein